MNHDVKNSMFLLLLLATVDASSVRVKTRVGVFAGKRETLDLSQSVRKRVDFDAFLGVPYAEPPVDDLRFLPPVPKARLRSVYTATARSPACMQEKDIMFRGFEGAEMWNANDHDTEEDCLYLNIWRPASAIPTSNLTVMVWIFGGGFFAGSPSLDIYRGAVLAGYRNVIVVNINYRVGPFGFIYLGDSSAPGNMGLLDQQMAIRWVHDNIASFGGNPDSITLFGESAGSASVTAHMLAPGSRPLFRRAILQSGAITNVWASMKPAEMLNHTMQLAKLVKCDDAADIADCLRKVKARRLSKLASGMNAGFMAFSFVPVTRDPSFFPTDVHELIKNGDFKKTDVLTGVVSDEGSFWTFYYLSDFFNNTTESLLNMTEYRKSVKLMFAKYSPMTQNAIGFEYLQKASQTDRCPTKHAEKSATFRDQISHMLGDYFFKCDAISFAKTLRDAGCNVHMFEFSERVGNNPWPDYSGVMHGYEIEFIFGLPLQKPKTYLLNGKEKTKFTTKIVDYWTQFAKTGKPTPNDGEWPAMQAGVNQFLKLRDDRFMIEENLKQDVCKFWKNVRLFEQRLTDSSASAVLPSILPLLLLTLWRI